jgi:NAD(P)H-flavin reductase/hemoglobin-like flavoprotein
LFSQAEAGTIRPDGATGWGEDGLDAERLRESWARVTLHGVQVPQFFYARLFLAYPQLRELFPVSMATQSDRLVAVLGLIVSNVDDVATIGPAIERLGRDHRRFAVRPEHYPLICEALLATLAQFLGDEWTDDLAADWNDAYTIVATVMAGAAAAQDGITPPWWEAEVVGHQRRGFDIAILRLRPHQAHPFRVGQSIPIETPLRPRLWRPFSPANAPRADGTIELHVKAVPGGQVSNALVNGVVPGDGLRLGAPAGRGLTLDDDAGRDLLLLAGGTGLAPLKAIVEELAAHDRPRRVALFAGARTAADFYQLDELDHLRRQLPWLTVTPVLSHDPYHDGRRGNVTETALNQGGWENREVYVCGPDLMVEDALTRLVAAGVPMDYIHTEDFAAEPYGRRLATPLGVAGEVSSP